MKALVKRDDLSYGLRTASRAISSRTTLPVLHNVLIATDESRLRISATDLELAITVWVDADVHSEGATTVPARIFSDFIGSLHTDGEVKLTYDDSAQSLHVSSGSSHATIKCIEADEFPPLPAPEISEGVRIPASEIKRMVRQVVFAASADDARPVLTGVFVKVEGDEMTAAASDGFRLSVQKVAVENPNEASLKLIVPARAWSEVGRAIHDENQSVVMVLPSGRNQVVFRVGDNVEVVSQLIEGEYPPYEQIIPRDYRTRTVVATSRLLAACKQAEIFAREGSQSVRLEIVPGNDAPGEILVSGSSKETGASEDRVPAAVEGEPLIIAFNVRYLREALEAIPTPEVALETIQPRSPALLRPVGDDTFLHIIMPMHL